MFWRLGKLSVVFACTVSGAFAGNASLEWDPVKGASGYRIYYGTESGSYSRSQDVGPQTEFMLDDLTDCSMWYIAVKAYNRAGESAQFSKEINGWARPEIKSVTPAAGRQATRFTLEVSGENFQPGASLSIDNPRVTLGAARVVSCETIQVAASVEPTAGAARAAEVGDFTLTVTNPDDVLGAKAKGFAVDVSPARFDVNRSDEGTTGRLDGKDTVWLSRLFGSRESDPLYDPHSDLNGDGWVDGQDLAYIAANLGGCWDGKGWKAAACPDR